ncbi:hypothetical protein PV325_009859 [Microctonus aethiopoides]|nr:hypothetical protein PV325_009859 [Microctonus aethiopoides]
MNNEVLEKIDADPENLLINPVTLRFLKQHNLTVNDVKQFYFGDKNISLDNFANVIDLHTDMHFIIGLHHFVDIQSRVSKTPTYLYKFEYEVKNSYLKNFLGMGTIKGTCHAEELNYIFHPMITKLLGKPPASFNSIEHCLVQRFTELWTNFAKTGNPTPETTDLIEVEWKPIDNSTDDYKYLEITDKLKMRTVKNITRQLMKNKNDKLSIMENPIVEVCQGKLRGINEKNINGINYVAFRGVPYAKPPIGNLRFKDCEPVESWIDVRDAVNFGNRCAQKEFLTGTILGSDDCLYLNIYTPTLDPITPKAVMVWIHGGAFICGSGEDDFCGFLNVEDEEAPGNQGLKDQVEALKWIQQNIAQFGGDPNNVTIFGESAGGAAVHYLTISPLSQGDNFLKPIFRLFELSYLVNVTSQKNFCDSTVKIFKQAGIVPMFWSLLTHKTPKKELVGGHRHFSGLGVSIVFSIHSVASSRIATHNGQHRH